MPEDTIDVSDNHVTEIKDEPKAKPQPDGVFVIKVTKDDGSIMTEVTPVGKVQATEVQTLLELGVKKWRTQIGLS